MARLRAIDIVQFSTNGRPAKRAPVMRELRPPTATPQEKPSRPRQKPSAGNAQRIEDWEPVPSMERTNLLRQTALALGMAVWVFLMLSFASFHPTDWPSHDVYPYLPIQNLCGTVGAFLAYYAFLAIGQGVFPVLFFTGVCLALLACRSRLSDPWLRGIGLTLLTVAFAAVVHHIRPGSFNGFPEGHAESSASERQHFYRNTSTRLARA